MKRSVKSLLLLCVLVLVLGGYWMMNRTDNTSSVSEESGSFTLTAKTADDLTGLEWEKDEVLFSFIQTDGVWQKTDNAAYPVDQSVVKTLADKLIALEANRKLENVEDESIYGLAEPPFVVTAHWSDGSSTLYCMGDETPFGDGYYLALSDQVGTAYTVSSSLSSMFNQKMDDFAAMESIPTVAEVTRITVGETLDASWHETSSTINPSQHWYSANGQALDGVDDLVFQAQSIKWAGLAEATATETQLSDWQLDDANAIALTLYDGDESISILFGATDESGAYYARLPESNMVYTVAANSVNDLLKATSEDMISLALAETKYSDLQEVVFTIGDLTHTVIPPVSSETSDETETSEPAEDSNEDLWKLFLSVEASEHTTENLDGGTLLKVNITDQTGLSAEFTFIEYNADNYAVTDGLRTMLVPADDVDRLIRTVKSMQ